MKTLFIVGQCIRLLGYDAWEVPTYYITNIGDNSYLGIKLDFNGLEYSVLDKYDSIRFTNQERFHVVPCPTRK